MPIYGDRSVKMELRDDIKELLSGFEKRMRFINLARCLIDYPYPERIRLMFKDNRAILDNLIVMCLLFIKDRTLGIEEKCEIRNLKEFLDQLLPLLPTELTLDTAVLAKYLIVDVLQHGGLINEFLTYNSIQNTFNLQVLRLLNENAGSYTLTDEALDFIFRSKEIESELDYSLARFRMQEYLKRDNYSETLEASKELVNRILNMKNSIDDFILRCREDIAKIAVDNYEKILLRIQNLLNEEDNELRNFEDLVKKRKTELEQAIADGLAEKDSYQHRNALAAIINNIDRTIAEQRSLINKNDTLADAYREILQDNFLSDRYEHLNFDRDIMAVLRQHDNVLETAALELLCCLTKPELAKKDSLENFYRQKGKLNEEEKESGLDMTTAVDEEAKLIQSRNARFNQVIKVLFLYLQDKDHGTVKDFLANLSAATINELLTENALLQVLLALYEMNVIDIAAFKKEERFKTVANGEFELACCLDELDGDLLTMQKIVITKAPDVIDFPLTVGGKRQAITLSDFNLEVYR